jgi:putative ABC transport system ATP-binding protein
MDKQLPGLRARRLGFMFQQFFLLDGLSVLANVGTAHSSPRAG